MLFLAILYLLLVFINIIMIFPRVARGVPAERVVKTPAIKATSSITGLVAIALAIFVIINAVS